MKKNLLIACTFLTASSLIAQVTKLSNNTSLSGFVLNGKVILVSDVDNSLWSSDGTAANTKKYTTAVVTDDDNGGAVVINNKLFFAGINSANGSELWVTDGTDGGTVLIKDIVAGAGSSTPSNFSILSGSTFLFFAETAANGVELWKSDGTTDGTVLVKDINPGVGSSVDADDFTSFSKIGNTVYFFANDGTHGNELWKTDGTTSGTEMVKDINPGSAGSTDNTFSLGVFSQNNFNNVIYFSANDGTHGSELWKTNGTTSGTVLVKDITTGDQSSIIGTFKQVNNKLLFDATSLTDFVPNLWITDGTENGTKKLVTSGNIPTSPSLYNGVLFGNKFLFTANDENHGTELWQTDGTAAGTKILKDINPGTDPSTPYFLQYYSFNSDISNYLANTISVWKGKAYFSADDGTHGSELWQTDGTAGGTKLLKDIFPGEESGVDFSNAYFTENAIFFVATESGNVGAEPYRTDGTADGTVLVKDIYTDDGGSSNPTFQFIFNNQLYFGANDGDGLSGDDILTDLFKIDATVTPLPVTLFDFAATLDANQAVKLDWSTATEINSDHFEIERSTDGAAFGKITSVAATGNSNVQRRYTYTDMQAAHIGKQLLYYRLKMVDKDGSFKYSGVLPIHMNNLLTFSLSPNPVANQLNVLVNTRGSRNVQLRITDASGKYLYQKTLPVNSDVYQQSINVSKLTRGAYYIQVVTDTQTKSGKFIKP